MEQSSLFSNGSEDKDFDSDCTAISDPRTNQINLGEEKRPSAQTKKRILSNNNAIKSIHKRYLSLPLLRSALKDSELNTIREHGSEDLEVSDNPNSVETLEQELSTENTHQNEEIPTGNMGLLKNRVREFDALCSDMLFTASTYHQKYDQYKLDFNQQQQDFFNDLTTKFKEMPLELGNSLSEEIVNMINTKIQAIQTNVKHQLDLECTRTKEQITQITDQLNQLTQYFEKFNEKYLDMLSNQSAIQETLNRLRHTAQYPIFSNNNYPLLNQLPSIALTDLQHQVFIEEMTSVSTKSSTIHNLAEDKCPSDRENITREISVSSESTVRNRNDSLNKIKSETSKKRTKKRRLLIT
ncbi:hypothetical protein K7432_002298 [Basidiobolus ranarum]|uniref:Uncharacterized protein n=1 Tax=Basidiobolus ranarum TaxID=34480 RepID=A0ABR2X1Q1_9FUNG